MITVTLYSRKNCQLCAQAQVDLQDLQEEVPHQVNIIDVDNTPKLQRKYNSEVPVVEIGPYRLKPPITKKELEITLRAVQHGIQQDEEISRAIETGELKLDVKWTSSDRFMYWMSCHYLAVFNLFILLYVGLPFLAPVFMKVGASAPAGIIYRAYSLVCHQLAFRSWFLFGEQAVYPRGTAHVAGLIPYGLATGLDESDVETARAFTGNPVIGYKVALCQRDVAIYGGILFFGIVYSLAGRRIKSMPWFIWVLLGIIPIGLDGGTQLVTQIISQPPLNLISYYRESTPFLRTLTGGLFGLTSAWFCYPMVEESMRDTLSYLDSKLKRVKIKNACSA